METTLAQDENWQVLRRPTKHKPTPHPTKPQIQKNCIHPDPDENRTRIQPRILITNPLNQDHHPQMPMRIPIPNTKTPLAILQTLQTTAQSDAKRHQTSPTDLENRHVHHQRTQGQHEIPRGDRNGHPLMALREQRLRM